MGNGKATRGATLGTLAGESRAGGPLAADPDGKNRPGYSPAERRTALNDPCARKGSLDQSRDRSAVVKLGPNHLEHAMALH
jgi:hypothetical protein